LLEVNGIVTPPAGAGVAIVAVPVEVDPATTVVGFSERLNAATLTVRFALADWPPAAAVIATVLVVPTTCPVTVKVAVVAPAGTVTVAGTVAIVVSAEVRATDMPPVGAALPRVTVPLEVAPPLMVVGFRATAVTIGGLTVNVADCAPEEMDGVFAVATGSVVTVKVPLVAPAAMVAVAGTVAEVVSLEATGTVNPPVGAGPLMVTVPVEGVPPMTAVGFTLTPVTVGAFTVKFAVFDALSANVPVMTTAVLVATGDVVIV
jgi:hypothetical protein